MSNDAEKFWLGILIVPFVRVLKNPLFMFFETVLMHEKYGSRPEILAGSIARKRRDQVWTPPPSGFIKLNMDGVRDPISGFAPIATMARDELGTWRGGVGRNIGRCSVVQVELWAIYDELLMAWDANWVNIIVETGCA
ncbi:uncharacterized protein LOC128033872 [Gossypium raimondii]|uniref:uncharacterized protein LOC128033872 n=1 Tax=Gossypium raimondii TaxID=29730 RepID=UPI00227C90C9|nr:uncharacterized protein LOC128033872 [Gossypium raimondii]